MKKHMLILPVLLVAVVALILGAAVPESWAIPLADTAIYIEINDTDGDAGIQIFLDGEGWDSMQVRDPDGNTILDVIAQGSVGFQGITELFLESAATLKGKARLTHALPAAPVLVLPVDGDDEVDPDNTVIEWELVADPPGSMIVRYDVVVEREEGSLRVFTAQVGPSTDSVTVPPEFMDPGTAYKFEVLAVEKSGNQTIAEREFETEE
jgi:hypothetical protein